MQGKTAVTVVLLLVLAGCSGATQSDPSPKATVTTSDTTQQPTQEATRTPTPTTQVPTTTTETTVVTTEGPPSNPWRSEVVFVSIDYYNDSQPVPDIYREAVQNATIYWNDAYTNYSQFEDIEFVVDVNATNPDVTVDILRELDYCGGESSESFVGCAPTYKSGEIASGSSLVEIEAGFTPSSTNETMRHEFGHMLGLEHGDDPMPLMAAESETVEQEVTDAVNRSYPWTKQNLTVAVTGSPTRQQEQQIQEALGYFEDGADGLLTETKPSFTMIENASRADIVIEATSNDWACGKQYDGGSCGDVLGYDEDVDRALEYYGDLKITLAGTRSDTTAWHVAYWLAYGMGATAEEMPEPLDGEDDNRDGNWWE